MAELTLEIITPARSFFKGVVKSVTVPGSAGSFQVLVNHAPIISTLDIGEIKIEFPDGSKKYYATGGGTIEVANNYVLVLVDSMEQAENIDPDRARKAAERAKERLSKREKETDLSRAENALKRANNRLRMVERKIRSEI